MIEVGYLVDSKGAQKFGTCASCGKGSDDDPKMVRVTYSHHDSISRTSNCLCADCRRLLLKTISDVPDTNVGNITNSCAHENDLISRQMAIDTIMGQPPEPHYPAWYAAQIEELPAVQPATSCSEIPNSSTDCISRQAAIDVALEDVSDKRTHEFNAGAIRAVNRIKSLPSAQPETAKRIVGKSRDGMTLWYQCDMCNEPVHEKDEFCPGCGRRLTDG